MSRVSVSQAMEQVKRADFVLGDAQTIAYFDVTLPIGFGQTISQPSVVKRMLEWLDISEGQKILDLGSGSGWTSALLATLVGPKGRVYAVERIPELVQFGRKNTAKYQLDTIEFYEAGPEIGLSLFAPYDRILVSASALELPEALVHQLKKGGKMVIPVGNTIYVITKIDHEHMNVIKHEGFVFVPLL